MFAKTTPTIAHAGRRSYWWLVVGLSCCLLFSALGIWQVERRAWKLDLIERVHARLNAQRIAAPQPPTWPSLERSQWEYTQLTLTGSYAPDKVALVQASTVLGAGFWVVAPFRTTEGWWVLVNRGFIPTTQRHQIPPPPTGEQSIQGLLRWTEPKGRWPRDNQPGEDLWYSRDVQEISQRLATEPEAAKAPFAPYFLDLGHPQAAPTDAIGPWPREGLTVVQFPNNHLVYALTWFVLAFGSLATGIFAWRAPVDE